MGRAMTTCLALALSVSACRDDVVVVGAVPAPPQALTVSYYAGVVTVSWELDSDWNGEAFRIYSRRVTDATYTFIAEVTSCDSGGFCTYADVNVVQNQSYDYYVTAVGSGSETSSSVVTVYVPTVTPPPVPDGPYVIALDGANFLTWGTASRAGTPDFSYYTVYLDDGSSVFLLGETDSEGFLDLLAANGTTYSYFVTAVDNDGHESNGSLLASGTPRPDYHGEWIYAFEDVPASSGFRFQADEDTYPILSGADASRDFRLESDGVQWWLVPGPSATVNVTSWATSALKCGVGADATCTDRTVAPATGYSTSPIEMVPQTTYILRMAEGGGFNYGAIRVEFVGFDASDAIMIFDWAFQLQSNNPNLVSPAD